MTDMEPAANKEEPQESEAPLKETAPSADEKQQREWRREAIRQQRLRNCPGCGDGDEVF